MLTIYDPKAAAHCDGISRRTFMQVGSLGLGGLALSDLLRSRAQAAPEKRRQKSVIMIFLSGGPSHLDMFDMKPDAPREYRGEFSPIATNVPGLEICELMPLQATIADKYTILRGAQLAHLHTGNEFFSGYPWQESPRASVPGEARRPAVGSVVSKLRGSQSAIPPYVSLEGQPDWERAYYIGAEHEPFRVGGGSPAEVLQNMSRYPTVSADRLGKREDLLHSFDTIRANLDRSDAAAGLDSFQARALEIVASDTVRDAFDVDREPEAIRSRYGDKPYEIIDQLCNVTRFHQAQHPGRTLLRARRLVEAGVSVVTCCFYEWDTHRYNFTTLRQMLPRFDQAVHALVTDLDDRGLLEDVAIVMGGEFGRTPRIGDLQPDGRSHWPEAGFLWLAGGGLKTGQVIGGTDARGERVIGNPIHMQHVLATLYDVLGIDPVTTFPDHNGRPQYVLEDRHPVPGLL